MKIGIDIHDTINRFPKFFSILIKILRRIKVEIHITTGVEKKYAIKELERLGIEYDYLFSITEYHKEIGTPIFWDEYEHPWISDYLWDKSKGDYCKSNKINIHIDNSSVYGKYFETPYIKFFKKGKNKWMK